MPIQEYCVYNESRENLLNLRVAFVDTRTDPLKAVKVLIEGLAPNAATGLWLNPLRSVPAVPRLSAYDLVCLDRNGCVVHGVELVPDDEAPRLDGAAASALVLPIHSFAASRAVPGDRFVLRLADEMAAVAVEARAVSKPAEAGTIAVPPVDPPAVALQIKVAEPAGFVAPAAGVRTERWPRVNRSWSSPEPSAAPERMLSEDLGPLAWPGKLRGQSTGLELVKPLAEVRLPAGKAPRFAWLHALGHLRIRVQISISTEAASQRRGAICAPQEEAYVAGTIAGDPGAAVRQGLDAMEQEKTAGRSRGRKPVQRLSKDVFAGAKAEGNAGLTAGLKGGAGARLSVTKGFAKCAALLSGQWTAFKGAYVRWAESFMFRPGPRPASVPPAAMMPPRQDSSSRKPRFLR